MSDSVMVASGEHFEHRLREAAGPELGTTVVVWPGLGDRPLAEVASELGSGTTKVLLLDASEAELAEAMAIAEFFDHHHPHVSVVLVAKPTTAMLEQAIQSGARGVLDPEDGAAEMAATLRRAMESSDRRRAASGVDGGARPHNRVVPVLAAKGGAGKTTMSVNLAAALGERFPGEVVIADLDLQFGDVATALGLQPEHTIADTLPLGEGLDSTHLKAFLAPKKSMNLYALCAPDSPGQADEITPAHVGRILRLLSQEFRFVVVDTSAGLDEMTLETLDAATDLVVLTSMDVPSVRATAKELDALVLLGTDRLPWHIVLNRSTSKVGLNADDIEVTLGHPIDVRVPSSRSVPSALNHGTPIYETDPRSPVSKAVGDLADRVAELETQRTGFLRRRSN